MAEDEPGPRYRFGPLERRGLVAGWRGGQIGLLAFGLAAAVLVVRGRPTPSGAVGAVLLVSVSVAAASWPLGGRTVDQWAPDAVRHARVTVSRRARSHAQPFGSLEILSVDAGGSGKVAVVHDAAARSYTAVLRAWGSGFVLLGASDKSARIESWSTALAALSRPGSSVHRLQWVARCVPDDGDAVRRHWDNAGVMDRDSAPQRSYAALLDAETTAARQHEVLLAVTFDARRAGRTARAAGGGRRGACTVVLREAARLRRHLADAGVGTGDVLDPVALVRILRSCWDDAPRVPQPSGTRHGSTEPEDRVSGWPWPMAMRAEWGRARVDSTWHATYWVAEWPRRDVGPEFLSPLLLCDVRHTLSLVMEPVAATDAARRIERARTADVADAELRRRGGFLATARRRREEEVLVQREHELADGHAQYRFSAYLTVTGTDAESLEEGCAYAEQAAAQSGLELRRCYGDQAVAFTCTMPFGRGLA